MNNEKKTPLQITVRILIIVGLIILLLLLTFGIIKLVPKAINGLSSLHTSIFNLNSSSTPAEKIVVSSNPAVYVPNSDGVVTWTQLGGVAEGYYTFQYDCANGITISNINCGQIFILGDATTTDIARSFPIHVLNAYTFDGTTTLTVAHRKANSTDIFAAGSTTISVSTKGTYTPSASATSSVTVVNNPPAATTQPPVYTNPPPYTNPSPAPIYHSPANLSVYITSTIPSQSINGLTYVKFSVTNNGGSSSGTWKFHANIPTTSASTQSYDSGYQSSIPAGKTSYFTLSFYGATTGTFSVNVDSGNNVAESNESNNTATTYITAPYSSYNYNNNYNNGNYNTGGYGYYGYGQADLSFTSIQAGVISSNGIFTPRSFIYNGEILAVQINVTNRGTTATGPWSYSAMLNDPNNYNYNNNNYVLSGTLPSLQPGENKTFTSNFSQVYNYNYTSGNRTITVTLDNNNQVSETNESNNTSSVTSYTQ